VRKVNFDRDLGPDGPVHGPSLLEVKGRPGRKAQAVEDFPAQEFALLDDR
jgi:hypothetical protein